MKKLVAIKTPNDYLFQGHTVHINPDDVSRVITAGFETRVIMKDGESITSQNTPKEVVAAIEAAL